MTVAAPVLEDAATSFTGRLPTSVKKPVRSWIAAARTIPINTAPKAKIRGFTPAFAASVERPESCLSDVGR